MKPARLLVVCGLLFLIALPPADAQPKDPFRPPAGSGPEVPRAVDGNPLPGEQPPDGPAAPGDGLARTGQDVGSPFAAGTLMLASGLALLLLERALAGRRGRGEGSERHRGRPARPSFPYA